MQKTVQSIRDKIAMFQKMLSAIRDARTACQLCDAMLTYMMGLADGLEIEQEKRKKK